jgi:Carboxypeptidase regulatory-like domain/TonB dependent receptor
MSKLCSHAQRIAILLMVLWATLLPLPAQTTFGSITGTVSDPTGAVIPGIPVTVTNEGTGQQRQTTTSSTGVFNVSDLPVGPYRIHVEAPGFSPFEQTGMTLNANQVIGLDVHLSVVSSTNTLEVSATAGVIDTQTSTLSYTKNTELLEQLPLIARTAADVGVFGFVYTNPGVSRLGQGNPSVNGNSMLDTTFSLDGIVVMAYANGMGGGPTQPNMEAVQEVNVELGGTQAEFARAANVTVITKSGSNAFHGSAYYDYNGNDLNARTYFANAVPFRVYNNFAGSIGGPIVKNKLFFFFGFDGSREAATQDVVGNTPLPAWRTGNFSGLSTTIIDPTTGLAFPGNQIPASRISPVSTAVQNYFYPLPNTGAPGLQNGNWNGERFSNTGYTHYNAPLGRVDWVASSKDSVFVKYNYRDSHRAALDGDAVLPPDGDALEVRPTQAAVVSWTHIFSPTMLNEIRAGFVRNYDLTNPTLIGSNILSAVGIEGVNTTGVPNPPGFNITGITTTQLSGSGSIGGDNANLGVDTDYQITDNLSWTHGAHFFKFGGDVIYDQVAGYSQPTSIYGTYNFTGTYTGFGYADFLLGIPQTTQLALPIPESHLRGKIYSLYAQDQYKVSSRLTLNYGVRYEIQTPYTDVRGDIFNFDPATGVIVVPNDGIANINRFYPTNLPIQTASQAGYPSGSLLRTNYHDFYPRFGLAWKPFNSDKTVIRGGYGIYGDSVYSYIALNQMVGGPFSGSETFTNKLTNGVPLFQFPTPFLANGTTATQNITGINPNLKVPYTQQFTLTLEQQIGQIGLRIGYVGSRAVNLVYDRNLNQPEPSTIPYSSARAYTDSQYNVVTYFDNGATEQYNALQISAAKTIGKNITFNTGFVWAKDLTDSQTGGPNATGYQIQNQFCLRCERGPNQITRPLRAYVNAIFTLPFGRDQKYLSHANRVVDAFLGGWSTSYVSEMEAGEYFTPTFSGSDPSNTNSYGPSSHFISRPDLIGNPNVSNPTLSEWFNPGAFAIPGCPTSNPICPNPANVGRFGNLGVNTLQGPKYINWDIAASKYFYVREKIKLQFRALATDAFNHPNFSLPATNISSPATVGTITSTFGEQLGEISRQVHFSVRLEF